jgi:hypothetical protein
MTIDALAEWLDKYGQFDSSPWMNWFTENYCNKCESIECHYPDSEYKFHCSWCELNDNKCKFFPDADEAPNNKKIIKLWLESEVTK